MEAAVGYKAQKKRKLLEIVNYEGIYPSKKFIRGKKKVFLRGIRVTKYEA